MYQHGDFKENDIVVGMLKAIEAKLCGLKSDTKAAEATAQKEYNSLMTKSKVDKASKNSMQLSPIQQAQARLHLADDDISDDEPAPKPKAKAAAKPTADSDDSSDDELAP